METSCCVSIEKLDAAMHHASDTAIAWILHGGHLHGAPTQEIQRRIQEFRFEPVRIIMGLTPLERAELPSRLRHWYERGKVQPDADVMT